MQLPTLLLCMVNNVIVVVVVIGIFSLMCYHFSPFIFPPFHLFSLQVSWCSFCFNPLNFPFFGHMFSKSCACTHASSIYLVSNNITCLCRCLCRPRRYLRSTFGFFGEIPSIMTIFLNFLVYSCTLYPDFYLR